MPEPIGHAELMRRDRATGHVSHTAAALDTLVGHVCTALRNGRTPTSLIEVATKDYGSHATELLLLQTLRQCPGLLAYHFR